MAKLLAARVAWAAADNALQIHGGNGFALEYPISRVLCDARILNIFEGAGEIQAQVIGRRLLEDRISGAFRGGVARSSPARGNRICSAPRLPLDGEVARQCRDSDMAGRRGARAVGEWEASRGSPGNAGGPHPLSHRAHAR